MLYVVGQLGCGGLERQLYYLFRAIDRQSYRPQLVVWNSAQADIYGAAIEALGIRIHRLRHTSPLQKIFALRRLVFELKPELVHSFTFHTNFAAWWAVQGTPAVAIGAVRSDFALAKHESGPLLGRLSARWPRHQIFNSRTAAESAAGAGGLFAPSEFHVVQNAVDLQRFSYTKVSAGHPSRLIGVGSLIFVKRWDRLVRAAAQIKGMGHDIDVQIVGEGPLKGKLREQIQALGLADCVRLVGYREDVPELLAQAHFLIHTSDSEGCPNVVAEAMACGRAVVATNTGDVRYLVDDGITGFLVPCADESLLVERMRMLIATPQLCERMGQAGRVKAEKELSLDRFVNETMRIYEKVGWRR